MRKRKIYNPVTGKWYPVWERSSKYGRNNWIKGIWSKKKEDEDDD